MEYDYRTRVGPPSSYDSQIPMYRQSSSSSSTAAPSSNNPMYGQQLYPKIGQPPYAAPSHPPPNRTPSSHHQPSAPASSLLGIRVALKPEYRIAPPPQLSPHVGDIPRSNFHFDFEFEKKILAEAEKDSQNWIIASDILPPKPPTEPTSSLGSITDPLVRKFVASGLSREAVPFAVETFGDNPTKVQEFVKGYNFLREMGFSSNNVAEALAMFDNDTNKALARFLNSST